MNKPSIPPKSSSSRCGWQARLHRRFPPDGNYSTIAQLTSAHQYGPIGINEKSQKTYAANRSLASQGKIQPHRCQIRREAASGEDGHSPAGRAGRRSQNGWHTDVTWMEKPSMGSIAQCIEVPPVGGDTLFSDSHACFLGLPSDYQQRLQHLCGINDYRIFLMSSGPAELPDDIIEGIKTEIPFGVSHPLLRTHPETGKTSLYIHGGFLRHDSLYDVRSGDTLDTSESQQIVNFLLQQHAKPEYVCRFKWLPGSIAFWDNRAVQHYAASDYYPHQRLLRRVTVSGDQPYYDPVQ